MDVEARDEEEARKKAEENIVYQIIDEEILESEFKVVEINQIKED